MDYSPELIDELEAASADSLISLYIPRNKSTFDVIAQLRNESYVASNIKDANAKQHIQSAIRLMINRLNELASLPDNGLVMFSGCYGKDSAVRLHTINPPKSVTFSLYRCDNHFTVRREVMD